MADDEPVPPDQADTIVIDHESDTEKNRNGSGGTGSGTNGIGETERRTREVVVAPSPAPISVPGGDDDFFTVSAVRKIKVTEPPIPSENNKSAALSSTTTNPTSTTATTKAPRNRKLSTTREEEEQQQRQQEDEDYVRSASDSSHVQEYQSDSEPMEIIEKSPYEINQDAEKGEPIFTRMKELLRESSSHPRSGDNGNNKPNGRGKVSDEAKEIFGVSDSHDLVRASSLIQRSGMVYSQEWTEGMIRGERFGAPKELILLCLVSNRLSKQGDPLLSGLTRDFGVSSIVAEGLKRFHLVKQFPAIMSVTKNYQFSKRRRDCYKAAIFVGRAFGCCKAFGNEGELPPSLKSKVLACLDMMEANLRGEDSKKKPMWPTEDSKKKPMLPTEDSKKKPIWPTKSVEKPAVDFVVDSKMSDSATPGKRKRGRPRKNPLPEDAQPKKQDNTTNDDSKLDDTDDSILDSPVVTSKKKRRKSATEALRNMAVSVQSVDEGDDADNMYAYNPPVRGGKTTGSATKSASTPKNGSGSNTTATSAAAARSTKAGSSSSSKSLPILVTLFEQQYNEMGKVYRKMGATLQELKSKILANRTATEEELRAGILLEVQDSFLKSFGKS